MHLQAAGREFLKQELSSCPPDRPVYILGESFGGVLALAVAAEYPAMVDRLVLVNPASCYPRSIWPSLGPMLPGLPPVRQDTAAYTSLPADVFSR